MSDVDVRPISAAETRILRSEVLRPSQRPEELVYFGDDAPDTLHAGAFLDGALVGIATVCRDPLIGEDDPDVWRLRGMAIRPGAQGKGLGRALLESCIAYVSSHGGKLIWCNGRTSAAGFYRSLGFEICGDEFEVAVTGPHYLMKRVLSPSAI